MCTCSNSFSFYIDNNSVHILFIFKVRQNIQGDTAAHASATVACFLVQEGAGMYLQNKKGHTPLQLCSPDVAALVTTFAEKKV